jgi:hypothetical protein
VSTPRSGFAGFRFPRSWPDADPGGQPVPQPPLEGPRLTGLILPRAVQRLVAGPAGCCPGRIAAPTHPLPPWVGFGPLGGVRQVSADGIELRFAVNHLAGYLLARRLTDRLVSSAPARIVQVASISQQALDLADLFTEQHYDGVTAYRRSRSGGRSGALKSGNGPARASPKPGGAVALHTINRGNLTVHHVPESGQISYRGPASTRISVLPQRFGALPAQLCRVAAGSQGPARAQRRGPARKE